MKKLIFILTTTLLWGTNAFSMHYARKGFSHICKAAKWLIVTTPFAVTAYQLNQTEEMVKQLQTADPEIKEFVHAQLTKVGIDDPRSIQIKISDDDNFGSPIAIPSSSTIIVPSSNLQSLLNYAVPFWKLETIAPELRKEIKNKIHPDVMKKAEAAYNQECFKYQHEGAHILNDRPYKIISAQAMGIAFGISIAQACKKAFFKSNTQRTAWRQFGHDLTQIPRGYILAGLGSAAIIMYKRYIEQRADDTVKDSIPVLQGGVGYLTQDYNTALTVLPLEITNNPLFLELALTLHDPAHPLITTRIAKLQARIDAIKAKETEASKKAHQA